jgi:hypothetical protein
MRARVAVVAVVSVVVLLPLSGCGHSESYCDTVRAHQSELGSIAAGQSRAALLQALPVFSDLQSKAPGDVRDDWQLLVARIEALNTALRRAGVDPASYDAKHPPPGLTTALQVLIRRAAAALAAEDARQALDDVQQEVLDVCHTPLAL